MPSHTSKLYLIETKLGLDNFVLIVIFVHHISESMYIPSRDIVEKRTLIISMLASKYHLVGNWSQTKNVYQLGIFTYHTSEFAGYLLTTEFDPLHDICDIPHVKSSFG